MTDLDRFNAACAAKGITSPDAFADHYGRRLSDLSLAKALTIITGEPLAGDSHFPPRCGPALYQPPPAMTRDEQTAWRQRWIANALPPLEGATHPRGETHQTVRIEDAILQC